MLRWHFTATLSALSNVQVIKTFAWHFMRTPSKEDVLEGTMRMYLRQSLRHIKGYT